MSASTAESHAALQRRPLSVWAAVASLLLCVLLREVPTHSLLAFQPSSEPSWFFESYYPGHWLVTPSLIVLAACVLKGLAWARFAVAGLAVLLLLAPLTASSPMYQGTVTLLWARATLVTALPLVGALLLFAPNARRWFIGRAKHGAA
jgi:hypothetical protein